MGKDNYLLEINNLTKTYPGIKALDNISFNLRKGEMHGLVGENGAGKSTLVKVISGATMFDTGETYVDGNLVSITSPKESHNLGISVVYQHLQLVDTMSVAENICLYQQIKTNFGFVNYKEIYKRAEIILNDLGVSLDISAEVKDLPLSIRQFVEIAKALLAGAKILILDEPTSSLNEEETKALFKLLKRLKEKDVGIIYVSHKFDEIFQITDRITVLRNGLHINTVDTDDVDYKELINMVIGKSLDKQFPPKIKKQLGDVVLEVKNITSSNIEAIKNISFDLKKGEILGIYGLQYSGLQEIANILSGNIEPDSGEIYLENKLIKFNSPKEAINKKIGYLTDDRLNKGIFPIMTVRENATLSSLLRFTKKGIINESEEKQETQKYIERLNIATRSTEQQVQYLSGGNQQKTVVARLLMTDAEIMILQEPTHGIDVGAKFEMYKLILELARKGFSILFISTEISEVVGLSDRIIVLKNGQIRKIFDHKDASREEVRYMTML